MLAQGTILRDHYEIMKKLGGGAFGDTYLAKDNDLPKNNQCVVKHLKPTSTNPQVLAIAQRLFETEAQVLDNLGSHNQIPRLLARFKENEEFYLVQEFVNGNDLGQELTPGTRFSEAEVIKLLHDILEVLEVVHQQNIIHRDIKPQNIMRRRIDEKIVLIDFGAVKQIENLVFDAEGQVKSTIAIGTPGYIPSEQLNRVPKLCSDIYAVGMIGIQSLTGLSPQQLQRDTTGELILRHYIPVSNGLMAVLNKMVRFHFSQRYQSAKEALQAVNALMPQPTHSFNRLISQVHKPIVRGSLIGLGGLGAGVLATFALINLPQLLNPSINFAIEPRFAYVKPFENGLAVVRLNGGYSGYIDKTGYFMSIRGETQPDFERAGDFFEGLAWFQVGDKWGYINTRGKLIIKADFEGAGDFSEGLAEVKMGDKWGYINTRGRLIIKADFDNTGDFSEGLAQVKVGDKWGYIDKTGKRVIQPQFDEAGPFSEGLAWVRKPNSKEYGYIRNPLN